MTDKILKISNLKLEINWRLSNMTDTNNYYKNVLFVLGGGFVIGLAFLIILEILAVRGILKQIMDPLSIFLF